MRAHCPNRRGRLVVLLLCLATAPGFARVYELHPAVAANDEELERVANALKPGDELRLHGGGYSQAGRCTISVQGTPEQPIVIRAATDQAPLLRRPPEDRDGQNNLEFVDCAHLVIRGLRFQGGSSGVRFIRGHHVTFEGCEIFETGNNALTMNSGDCHAFMIRSNHLHHTGLSTRRPTEGEGMYNNVIHNTIWNAPMGVRLGWSQATNMVLANNAVFCATGTAVHADGVGTARLLNNAVHGRLVGLAAGRNGIRGGPSDLALSGERTRASG